MLREQAQKGGGFAGLSGASQHNHWARLRGALQAGFNTRVIHIRKIYDTIAYFAYPFQLSPERLKTAGAQLGLIARFTASLEWS